MWESVLSTNAREIAPLLERVGRELIAFAQHLEDGAAVRAVFAAANEQRRLLDQHPTPQTPAH
jgi:hypothetical protein